MIKLDSYTVVPSNDGEFQTLTFKSDDVDIDFTITKDRNYVELNGTVNINDLLEAIELVLSGKVVIEL